MWYGCGLCSVVFALFGFTLWSTFPLKMVGALWRLHQPWSHQEQRTAQGYPGGVDTPAGRITFACEATVALL